VDNGLNAETRNLVDISALQKGVVFGPSIHRLIKQTDSSICASLTKNKMKLSELHKLTGGLSAPSKMPCHGYSIPASACRTGSKLRSVAGSTCSSCYACKGRYQFDNVQSALNRRLDAIHNTNWIDWMVILISRKERSGYFRWHDSGDLQSMEHLKNIIEIANRLPSIKFWLPTRETGLMRQFVRLHGSDSIPENLTIRVSAAMVGGDAVSIDGCHMSRVDAQGTCPAPQQGNQCQDCRACWDKSVNCVTYSLH